MQRQRMMSLSHRAARALRTLKVALRQRTPEGLWAVIGGALRGVSGAGNAVLAAVIAAILWPVPRTAAVRIRASLARTALLDYDGNELRIRVTSASENLRVWPCAKEPETVRWIVRTVKPDDTLYDIGANVGAYALIAAAATAGRARVYAFEPVPSTFADLVENIFLNGTEDTIVAFQVALSDRTDLVPFEYVTTEAGGASHPGVRATAGATAAGRRHAALCYRLDDFARAFRLPPPTHIKLDVDGSEALVLAGAPGLLGLRRLRSVLVEVSEGDGSREAVSGILGTHGFALESEHPHHGNRVCNLIFSRPERGEGRPA
jgi:FkbM family methyltransferase